MHKTSAAKHTFTYDALAPLVTLMDATKTLLSAFVLQKLDYCNSLFYCNPIYMLE